MFRKESLKSVFALLIIAVGLAGFLWEFTVVDNDKYTIVDTHYGNRLVHYAKSMGGNAVDKVAGLGENADEAVLNVLTENVAYIQVDYSLRNVERNVPGIEWLTEPILPENCFALNAFWSPDFCTFRFTGEFNGTITGCRKDFYYYRNLLETYAHRTENGETPECYSVGDVKVMKSLRRVDFIGVRNGICFFGTVNESEGMVFEDSQIAELGMRYSPPESREVTILVLINVLRGLCLATAVAGVVLLAVTALKRKEPVAVTEEQL